ncbi:type II toxin-antitoxin system RelB/DinJ family antitoxin [Patescibacteria group bacterium]|nr:type II toxin-antitoxin system RelB/DinJ family antitoxin [Patescibacteria group bacterium]
MTSTTLQIRIDKKEKEETRKVFEDLGMTLSSATKMFYNQARKTKSLPIKGLTENGFTPEYEEELIKEAEWALKYGKSYSSAKEMFDDILKR